MAIPVFHPTPRALDRYGRSTLTALLENANEVIGTIYELKKQKRKERREESRFEINVGLEKEKIRQRQKKHEEDKAFRKRKQESLESHREKELRIKEGKSKENEELRELRKLSLKLSNIKKSEELRTNKETKALERQFNRLYNQTKVSAAKKGMSPELQSQYVAEKLDEAFQKNPKLADVAKFKLTGPKSDDTMAKIIGMTKYLNLPEDVKSANWQGGTTNIQKQLLVEQSKAKQRLSPERRKVLDWILALPTAPPFDEVYAEVAATPDEEIAEYMKRLVPMRNVKQGISDIPFMKRD